MASATQDFEAGYTNSKTGHFCAAEPSPWITRFGAGVEAGGAVLDLACGNGRHGRWFIARGHPVTLVDINTKPVADLADRQGIEVIARDLEADEGTSPLAGRAFAAICVVNYLHRPLFADIAAWLAPGGLLLYETFADGNAAVRARPRNPAHLLNRDELLTVAATLGLSVCAFEQGLIEDDGSPAIKQRLAAIRQPDGQSRPLALYP